MAITEEARHHLYLRLEEVLGPEEANHLMEHLPPVGWADVATKHDLDQLEQRMDLRFAGMELRMDGLEQRMATSELRFEDRLARGLAALELRLTRAFSDLRDEVRGESVTFRAESRSESVAFRDEIRAAFAADRAERHAEQWANQRQIIVLLMVALISLVAAVVGLR